MCDTCKSRVSNSLKQKVNANFHVMCLKDSTRYKVSYDAAYLIEAYQVIQLDSSTSVY